MASPAGNQARAPRWRSRRGMVVPLVISVLVLFGLYATTLLQSSKGEYRLTKKSIARERAKMLARAGMAHATALIYQVPFEERWYKQNEGPYGYWGSLESTLGEGGTEGYYRVIGEDVASEMPEEWKEDTPEAKALRIENLTYSRIDLFAEGVFLDSRVILYESIVLYPEQKVYAAEKEEGEDGSVTYTDVRVR